MAKAKRASVSQRLREYLVCEFLTIKNPDGDANRESMERLANTIRTNAPRMREKCQTTGSQTTFNKLAFLGQFFEEYSEYAKEDRKNHLSQFDTRILKESGVPLDEFVSWIETRGKQKVSRPPNIHSINIALRSFVESEREGDDFSRAVTRALNQIAEEIENTDHQAGDRSVRHWLKVLQEEDQTTIPPPRSGRPPKEN